MFGMLLLGIKYEVSNIVFGCVCLFGWLHTFFDWAECTNIDCRSTSNPKANCFAVPSVSHVIFGSRFVRSQIVTHFLLFIPKRNVFVQTEKKTLCKLVELLHETRRVFERYANILEHLVFADLNTSRTCGTVERIVNKQLLKHDALFRFLI